MTRLEKPVRRELPRTKVYPERWIVSIEPAGISFRQHGKRTWYSVDWDSTLGRAIRGHVAAELADRPRRRQPLRRSGWVPR